MGDNWGGSRPETEGWRAGGGRGRYNHNSSRTPSTQRAEGPANTRHSRPPSGRWRSEAAADGTRADGAGASSRAEVGAPHIDPTFSAGATSSRVRSTGVGESGGLPHPPNPRLGPGPRTGLGPGPDHKSAPKVSPRRASPPRPSLLCGDLANCHRVLGELRHVMESAHQFDQSNASAFLGAPRKEVTNRWQSLVRRARSLRETLVSLHEMSPFTREAYELTAEICLRAHDWGEFLKCQQQLVQVIYPVLEGSDRLGGSWRSTRWAEFISAGIVYFGLRSTSIISSLELTATIRGIPRRFLSAPPIQLSLQLLGALTAGDYIGVLRLEGLALPSVALILRAHFRQIRERAVMAMSNSYNTIHSRDMQEMLGLRETTNELREYLANAEKRGCVSAARALANWPETAQPPPVLAFK